ncbi:hypothetical protein HETIRDRAFT_35037 [Heterobasidion irregulare TC 32-1]|uniref:C2H2-type domain-containing protein n=1 Tax=Heterobasidion irregulare (strain TC 32-1) TaxID=747525 RepID=W4KFN0_HETIT|nr:uncharacterized protein HETIRDRAFT_35037 [Heterobasidion irregulare TC 32-1]ETW84534.1 hypothetical protein HETIRDRAFT_35037 [Heterobasidion irregulare TC 32-1]
MSWSSSVYPPPPPPPPPRHSRSRSPYRGSYPPRGHSDSYPPADPYRPEWDAYDRDRWAYDREKPAYDYGRRGRSRSPPAEEAGRKRRRSASPFEKERFDPRPRYADDYDAHSRSYGGYSPRRGAYPQPGRRPPADPYTLDYPATLKVYAEWFRYYYPQQAIDEDNADKAAEQEAGDGSRPRNGIRTRWEKYKKDFAASQLQTMFDHHRKSPWFAEKYDPSPEFVTLRKRVRKDGWRGRLNAFIDDLEAGKFDPDVNQAASEPASFTKEDGDTTFEDADADGVAPTDEKAVENAVLDGDDEGGDNEGGKVETNGKGFLDAKRNNRGEEMSVLPEGNQVMIRTIPPDIGRVKLEAALENIPGYVYLALGDPLQKRNYYRAGWLKFRDDADMPAAMSDLNEKKIEGFKLHVMHNTEPFRNRIRYAPEVASRPERLEKDLEKAKAIASLLESEYLDLRRMKFPRRVEQIGTGEEDANGNVEQDVTMAETEVIDDATDDPEPIEKGTDAIERRIEKLVAELRESGSQEFGDEKEVSLKKTELSLDLYLAYLRSAFHTCYYCAVITDHLEELQRKCIMHVRKPLSKALKDEIKAAEADKAAKDEEQEVDKEKEKDNPTKPADGRDWKRNDERWLEWLDSKIALLIDRDGVDPRQYGGKSYDEELSKAVEPFVKQEDEGKFRCKTCQKLFKATSFVEKHIANKHGELVKHLDDIPYFNNFALDPHHIQPFSHPPAATGNNQAPPPQAYGLPGPVTYPPPGDYGRGGPYHPAYAERHGFPQAPPALYPGTVYWDPYTYPYTPGTYPPARRDEGLGAKRLSDRISGYAIGYDPSSEPTNVPASAGLPPKPAAAALEAVPMEENRGRRGGRRGGRGGDASGPPPPPPPDAKEDPRAAAGKKVSYHDMDLVAEGDVELQY